MIGGSYRKRKIVTKEKRDGEKGWIWAARTVAKNEAESNDQVKRIFNKNISEAEGKGKAHAINA